MVILVEFVNDTTWIYELDIWKSEIQNYMEFSK